MVKEGKDMEEAALEALEALEDLSAPHFATTKEHAALMFTSLLAKLSIEMLFLTNTL